MALNKVILMGRLGSDPEMRRTQTGTAVASFNLAVDRDFKDKDTGEKATDWIPCVAWRSTAEFAQRYLGKGRQVVVVGSLQIREWTDKEGNKRRNAEVVCDNIYFADSKKQDDAGEDVSSRYQDAQKWLDKRGEQGFAELSDDDGKLPF